VPGSPDDFEAAAGRLKSEIAELSRHLAALPLEKKHRDDRLKLNDLKRAKESELAEVLRSAALERARARLRAIDAELRALDKGPSTRERRKQLLDEQREVKRELELAEHGGAS
jgi:hypothetical protein